MLKCDQFHAMFLLEKQPFCVIFHDYFTCAFSDSHKSLVLQILSQLRIGMDLTKFALPVYILEKRSLLEMYAEFFAHPNILTR